MRKCAMMFGFLVGVAHGQQLQRVAVSGGTQLAKASEVATDLTAKFDVVDRLNNGGSLHLENAAAGGDFVTASIEPRADGNRFLANLTVTQSGLVTRLSDIWMPWQRFDRAHETQSGLVTRLSDIEVDPQADQSYYAGVPFEAVLNGVPILGVLRVSEVDHNNPNAGFDVQFLTGAIDDAEEIWSATLGADATRQTLMAISPKLDVSLLASKKECGCAKKTVLCATDENCDEADPCPNHPGQNCVYIFIVFQ